MPSHITHEVFVRESFKKALGTDRLTPFGVFGAQGADFFLHNHRTKPTALIFGKLLHSEGYGRFVGHLLAYGRERKIPFDSPFGAFTSAFATHPVLDRITHPFINYYAGWVTPLDPQSEEYRNCHVFYERIIDVFVLRMRAGIFIDGYDFLAHVDCGDQMPAVLSDSITDAVIKTYPDYTDSDNVRRRVENAYQDTRGYFAYTNPPDRERVRADYRKNREKSKPPGKLLALLHPGKLPDIDYLNLARKEWNHPGNPRDLHSDSFFDLYEQAVEQAVPVVHAVAGVFEGTISCDEAAGIIGNENLSDGQPKKIPKKLKYVRPLPLQEVMREIYPL